MSAHPRHKVIHFPKIRMLSQGGRPHSKIKITNVKSVKPPNPEVLKKQEEEKLRAQLQKEIVSRSRTCLNNDYWCGLPVVSGRQFCARHILQDSSAPYKHCAHTYGNGYHCPMPAPVDREQALCFEHARAALHARHRSAAPPPPVVTTETLLHQLNHYVRPERTRTTSCTSSVSVVSDPSEQDLAVPIAHDPFKQIDATIVNVNNSLTIMECASASDSDCESITLGPEGDSRGNDEHITLDDLIAESQSLWRAGVYTVEEAVREAKNVHKALQTGYFGQMGRLRILLQTARQFYLKSLKTEREQYCSINSQSRSGPLTVKERKQLRKLKAYAGYHHKYGADAILARKLLRKRAKLNDFASHRPIPSQGRCTFTEGGVRCASHVLPAAKHCLKHVLHDQHQVLFVACGDPRGSESCREPVARLPLPSAKCRYHTDPPAYTPFTLKVLFVACGDPRGSESCREPVARLPLPSAKCRYHTDPPAYTPFTLKVLFVACGDPRGSESCREPVARLPLPSAKCRYHTDPPAYTPFTLKVLFVACGDPRGSESCREPVARLPLPSAKCRYHTDPPAYTPFTLKKDDSEDDSESRSLSSSATEDGIETFDETNSEIMEGFIRRERL